MSNAATVIDISEAIIAKGQRAWTRIKATAEEQRVLWLEIGNALAVGRMKNPSNQDFGKWCTAAGFGDMKVRTRSAALQFAALRPEVTAGFGDMKVRTRTADLWFAANCSTATVGRPPVLRVGAGDVPWVDRLA